MGLAMSIAGAQAPRLMAALTAAFALGQIAGPVFISVMLTAGGRFDTGLLMASLILAASACVLFSTEARA